jgi:hypothetical protein
MLSMRIVFVLSQLESQLDSYLVVHSQDVEQTASLRGVMSHLVEGAKADGYCPANALPEGPA